MAERYLFPAALSRNEPIWRRSPAPKGDEPMHTGTRPMSPRAGPPPESGSLEGRLLLPRKSPRHYRPCSRWPRKGTRLQATTFPGGRKSLRIGGNHGIVFPESPTRAHTPGMCPSRSRIAETHPQSPEVRTSDLRGHVKRKLNPEFITDDYFWGLNLFQGL